MKKFLLLILCLVSSLMVTAESGTCGASLTWSLEDGLLVISGTGAMTDYDFWTSQAPWYSYLSTISRVIIKEGVTSIGVEAFRECSGLTSVTIPNSVTSIGESAFFGCRGLTSVTIPNSVTSIGDHAFWYCSGLPVIGNIRYADCVAVEAVDKNQSAYVIKEGIRFIHGGAFDDCSSLTSITIPNSVTSIGEYAFGSCSGLTSITIPNSVTSIGRAAFSGCSGLTSVTIPNSVTSIGGGVFYGCSGLTSINVSEDNSYYCSVDGILFNKEKSSIISFPGGKSGEYIIPNSVISIGDDAFAGCSGLTSITIPNSVRSIGFEAFERCSGLISVTIGNSVASIGDEAFYKCCDLTSVNITDLASWCNIDFGDDSANPLSYANKLVLNGTEIKDLVIPEGVTAIKDDAFAYCSGLTSVTIPNSVTSIGGGAFYGCSGLTSVTIGNSVTNIECHAFYNCSGLTSITIPNSVTNIVSEAFYGCSAITEVYSLAEVPPTIELLPVLHYTFSEDVYTNATLYVPTTGDALAKYSTAKGWEKFKNIKVFDATGIDAVAASDKAEARTCYNLQGQRIAHTGKGLNIQNGKKTLMH